jgi:hypothetical protein
MEVSKPPEVAVGRHLSEVLGLRISAMPNQWKQRTSLNTNIPVLAHESRCIESKRIAWQFVLTGSSLPTGVTLVSNIARDNRELSLVLRKQNEEQLTIQLVLADSQSGRMTTKYVMSAGSKLPVVLRMVSTSSNLQLFSVVNDQVRSFPISKLDFCRNLVVAPKSLPSSVKQEVQPDSLKLDLTIGYE